MKSYKNHTKVINPKVRNLKKLKLITKKCKSLTAAFERPK